MPETESAEVTPSRVPSGYTAIWALFTDWCAATGHPALPADPATVTAFLTDCPAAPETRRRRVAAIDHHHTTTRHAPPGRFPAVRAALGRPTGQPPRPSPDTAAAVDAALRALPSHGWTHGMFGRRDRCLLVLSQLAGVPYRDLATATAGDVTLVDGTVTIRWPAGEWTLRPADDGLVCGVCAVVRWLEVLEVAATKVATAEVAGLLKGAPEVTGRSPHVCRTFPELSASTRVTPLLSPIDQWGALPFPPPPLTPHSLSRRARDLLAGDLGAHRSLDVEPPEPPVPDPQPAVVSPPRPVYSSRDREQAWARRRADLQGMAGITDALTDVEQRADELNRRATTLLDSRP
jgi:hypothetical protein